MLKKLSHFARLDNRTILSIKGRDAFEILQGITTNDIRQIQQSQSTLFLNTNGRIICEAILHRPQIQKNDQWQYCNDEIWMDIDIDIKSSLVNHIKKFLIRKKVQITDYEDQLHIFQVYGQEVKLNNQEGEPIIDPNNDLSEEGDYRNIVAVDPRSSSIGIRMVTNDMPDLKQNDIQVQDQVHFEISRLTEAIFEGKEVVNKIPFQVNFDFWNSINLTKGCYVGQELTARTYHTGVIRKRLLPFKIVSNDNTDNLEDQIIINGEQEVGKVVKSSNNFGIANVNYLDIDLEKEYQVGNKIISFILQEKLRSNLIKYIELIQSRKQ
ncbi:unnamed protein product [Paramecium pentaurelia]|uniref:Aminomethyltransferase folate-binding domain-containing protein n=1 Tax=Paramecium pentaurelia TaxID=43138 RepID=A0A8S1ULQ8_9CILI|nr:unnamed protein product [Paramecium pentaurelia]